MSAVISEKKEIRATTCDKPRLKHLLPRLFLLLFWLSLLALLAVGWQIAEKNYTTAESGLGYALGVVGGSLMLLLLLYPLGKRIDWLVRHIALKHWFRLHMICGVLGPVFILFHANFQTGSRNSTAAMISMLIVSVSGLFGRYFYTRIHHGLYGRKRELSEFTAKLEEILATLAHSKIHTDKLLKELVLIRKMLIEAPGFLVNHFFRVLFWRFIKIAYRNQLLREISNPSSTLNACEKTARVSSQLDACLSVAGSASEFLLYQRIFSAWHVLHIPLFVLLIITALVHIYAVHTY